MKSFYSIMCNFANVYQQSDMPTFKNVIIVPSEQFIFNDRMEISVISSQLVLTTSVVVLLQNTSLPPHDAPEEDQRRGRN